MKLENQKQADGTAHSAAVPPARKADIPTRLAILRSLRQLHLLFLGLFSGKQIPGHNFFVFVNASFKVSNSL
jgi:hypothetical protein